MRSIRLSIITSLLLIYFMIFTATLGSQDIAGEGQPLSNEPYVDVLPPDENRLGDANDEAIAQKENDEKEESSSPSQLTSEQPSVTQPSSEPTVVSAAEEKEDGLIYFESRGVIVEASQYYALRKFEDIFPNLNAAQRSIAMGRNGLRHSFERGELPSYPPDPSLGIHLYDNVIQRNPSHLIEALIVIPYNEKELDMLDIYNALGRIEYLKNQTIRLRTGEDMNVFKETTRLDNAQNRRAIPDPPPATTLPYAETMYLRFTDAYIGSLFIRGDISLSLYGITYNLTNFRDISFSVFRIMGTERVSIILYLEPIEEGVLIYSVSGLYLPGFIVNKMNLTPNINNRISVLIRWITEGLRAQEVIARARDKESLLRNLLQNEHFIRLLNTME